MIPKSETGVSPYEATRAVLECEYIFQSWTVLDPDLTPEEAAQKRVRGGAPRTYPLGLLVLFDALVDVHVRARAFITALVTDPREWPMICTEAARYGIDLPAKPPSRAWYVKTKRRLGHDQIETLREASGEIQLKIAEEVGLLPADASRNTAHPRVECVVTCDGKVEHPPSSFVPGDTRQATVIDADTARCGT